VIIAPTATFFGVSLGLLFGLLAGYYRGWVETVIMRLADILFAFPGILLAILIAATVQTRIEAWLKGFEALEGFVKAGFAQVLVVIVALSAVGWPGMARLVRGQVLSLREEQFVEAAWAIGARPWQVIKNHILPNAMAPIVVSVSMSMGGAIMAEAGLSFMGIGIRPPTPSWGALIIDNYSFWDSSAALVLLWLPALIVGAMVAAFNFVGDGLNEALSPGCWPIACHEMRIASTRRGEVENGFVGSQGAEDPLFHRRRGGSRCQRYHLRAQRGGDAGHRGRIGVRQERECPFRDAPHPRAPRQDRWRRGAI